MDMRLIYRDDWHSLNFKVEFREDSELLMDSPFKYSFVSIVPVDEVRQWVKDTFEVGTYALSERGMSFDSKDDALLFILRWTGHE